MTSPVIFEKSGAVATLTLNRPEMRNAVDRDLTNALRAAIRRFEDDDALRVAVLTGAGDVFCAGMDLGAYLAGDGDDILFQEGRFAGFVDAKRTKPIIAAVEGAALAGGFEIALACD